MKFATVGYWRVSTDRQGRDGVSLDEQAAAGARWCREHDAELVASYVEDESAWTKRGARRPALRQALDFIRREGGRVRYFLVYDLSRFARNLFDQLTVQQELARLGVQLTTVTLPLDDTAHGRAIAGYLGVTNQLQSDLASEKIQGAMLEVVRRGRSPHLAPVGYRNALDATGAKTIVIDQDRGPLVRRGFELAASGWRPTRIAEELERLGLRSRAGKRIRQQEIRKILANRVYMGRVVSHRHGLDVAGAHEPLVSAETWAAAQRVLGPGGSEMAVAQRNVDEQFPLRGLLRCRHCGERITASQSRSHTGRHYAYYHCWAPACRAVRVRREMVEQWFFATLHSLEMTPGEAALLRATLVDAWRAQRAVAAQARERLVAEADRLERRRDRLVELLVAETLDPETYEREAKKLSEERERVHFELARGGDPAEDLETLMLRATPLLTSTSELWRTAPVAAKRRLQALLFPLGVDLDQEGLRTRSKMRRFSDLATTDEGKTEMVEHGLSPLNHAWWQLAAEIVAEVAA